MKAKEKAKELVYKCDETLEFSTPQRFARKCALIAVDEIIEYLTTSIDIVISVNALEYWQQVKKEIEKI